MASDVSICNLALGLLGDDANVISIDPPEGSAQAEHCAQFYPIARDAMLEMHPWNFATRRALLAELTNPPTQWQHTYGVPSDLVNVIAVLDSAAVDDYSVPLAYDVPFYAPGGPYYVPTQGAAAYTPQPFEIETLADGTDVLYTNQANALLRYTALVTDPGKFTPLFVTGCSILLGSMLAGPVIKGKEGRAASMDLLNKFNEWFAKAVVSDANQRRVVPTPHTAWISGR